MSVARVTHAEANLLTLARCVVGSGPAPELTRLLLVSVAPPTKLGPTSAALLEDTLARGVAFAMLQEGGWTNEVDGRLWSHPLPPLHFTANTVRLLQWALRLPLAEPEVVALKFDGRLTPAEEVFAALLLERARGTAAEATLMSQAVLRELPLVQLMHAATLGRVGALTVSPLTKAHLPWVRGLLDLLGDTWLSAELLKPQLAQPKILARVGRAQSDVAASFLDVVDAQQHRHLARFFIDAAAAWLATRSGVNDLVALDPESPLRERGEARQQAGALWRVLERLEQWDQQHRGTRFIDDGYDVAQALVKDWERLGPNGFAAARRLVAELESLPT
ncbi:MAG: hypothetical protein JNJ54_32440 [Myxococcaceae bacterium]|nr:hypothetical protein [Myxococcaceae bacterium]